MKTSLKLIACLIEKKTGIQWGTVIRDGSGLDKFVPYISITLYEIFLNFECDVITMFVNYLNRPKVHSFTC